MGIVIEIVSPCDNCKNPSPLCRKHESFICDKYRKEFIASWNEMAAILRNAWGLGEPEEVAKSDDQL